MGKAAAETLVDLGARTHALSIDEYTVAGIEKAVLDVTKKLGIKQNLCAGNVLGG